MSIKDYGIDKLSAADRLQLAQEIWDSIGLEALPTMPDWQLQELERRMAAYDAHPQTEGRSWEEVKARIRATP
ncbi:MAG: addiction module protein [Gemmatales bacterium]